jgi:signal transduction histidine kinase
MMTQMAPFGKQSPYTALEQARRERLLAMVSRMVAWVSIPVVAIYTVLFVLQFAWQTVLIVVLAVLVIVVSLVARRLGQRGKTAPGSYILTIYLLLAAGIIALLVEGLSPFIAQAYTTIIFLAGTLLRPRDNYIIAAIAAVAWAGTLAIAEFDLIPQISLIGITPVLILVSVSLTNFVFVAIWGQRANNDLQLALNDAAFELVQTNRQLMEASHLKSRFMAQTSHELRSPLNSIMGFTELALRDLYGPLTPDQADALGRVRRNSKYLLALINDILDVSKIETGELQLADEIVRVKFLADALQSNLGPLAREKGLEFTVRIVPEMPPHISGDGNRIVQVLLKLGGNAIKFTDQGSVSITIEPIEQTRWHALVDDTGRGIHERDFDQIFDEFYRVEVTDKATRGAGLGLAIVRHLVQMMKGEINVTSQIGKGSTFEVILPLKVPEGEGASGES